MFLSSHESRTDMKSVSQRERLPITVYHRVKRRGCRRTRTKLEKALDGTFSTYFTIQPVESKTTFTLDFGRDIWILRFKVRRGWARWPGPRRLELW